MAEPLKNQFGADIPRQIAGMMVTAWPDFDTKKFARDCLDGYEPLDLMQRGSKIAHALHKHLPRDYATAIRILLASLGPKLDAGSESGMAPFLYLPHTRFVAAYGLEHFDVSMQAQYELTQRFTAEFSIRPFIERYPQKTLARLKLWAHDPSAHVRRLVSEGTRPRLPWAPRLRDFQRDPQPVLQLLELLKDDPELYVRRSVANNLNDIGKDHPAILVTTARCWLQDASDDRRWLVRHALRSALKRAEPGALDVLGFGKSAKVAVDNARITPKRVTKGDPVSIACEITNTSTRRQRVLVDLRVHFIKANGKPSPKVFKLKVLDLAPQQSIALQKKISLAEMTTRKHYAGVHHVEIVLNGSAQALGDFRLLDA